MLQFQYIYPVLIFCLVYMAKKAIAVYMQCQWGCCRQCSNMLHYTVFHICTQAACYGFAQHLLIGHTCVLPCIATAKSYGMVICADGQQAAVGLYAAGYMYRFLLAVV